MTDARYKAASVVVNGQLWVIGGETPAEVLTDRLDAYDPVSDAWATLDTLRLPAQRREVAAVVLDGDLYVMGGRTHHKATPRVDAYIPRTAAARPAWARREE